MNQSDGDASLVRQFVHGYAESCRPGEDCESAQSVSSLSEFCRSKPPGTGCYFLPDAFAVNTDLGTFGTANRRFFHGPGFNNTDFGLLKRTQIQREFCV